MSLEEVGAGLENKRMSMMMTSEEKRQSLMKKTQDSRVMKKKKVDPCKTGFGLYNVHCLGRSWTRGVTREQESLLIRSESIFK